MSKNRVKDTIRKDKIMEHIHGVIPSDKKIVLVDVYDAETGELYDSEIPIFKKDYKEVSNGVLKQPLKPYVILNSKSNGKGDVLGRDYYNHFTRAEKGYLFDLFRSIDSFGRIKYGENYQQYCRTFEDLAKVLDVSYNTIKQTLIPKMKKYDLVRVITITKGHEFANESFISFNPVLVTNGVFWDRWCVLTWRDVIEKYNLLSTKEINKILGCETNFKTEGRAYIPRELNIWE